MKKTVLIIVVLVAGLAALAQRPVGDTMRILDTSYYCQPRDLRFNERRCTVAVAWQYFYGLTPSDYHQPYGSYSIQDLTGGMGGIDPHLYQGNGKVGRQMHTDRPLKVLGIAAPVWRQPGYTIRAYYNYESYTVHDTSLATRVADSMALYQMTPGGLVELASAGWRMDAPHRTMEFFRGILNDDGANSIPLRRPDYEYTQNIKVPLYEVMFEKPVIVEDSFVVAGIAMNNEGHFTNYPHDEMHQYWAFDHNPTRYLYYFYEIEDYAHEFLDVKEGWYKFRNLPWVNWYSHQVLPIDSAYFAADRHYWCQNFLDNWWRDSTKWVVAYGCPLVFPIIELDFDTALCHEVSGLRVAERGAGQATLMWNSGDGGPWEVAIGKLTDTWEDFTITTTTVPMITVTGLERGVQYFALVRGYCGLTDAYGEWSSPLEVEVYQDHDPGTGREGIGHEAVEDGMLYMVPNPTSGVTNVMSSYRMRRIAVYDIKGVKVHEQEVDGISAVVDASTWPKGVYIVAMYLDHGVKTRRLVVQ